MIGKETMYGVGYLNGEKPYSKGNCEYEYEIWSSMMQRCYGRGASSKYHNDCSVSDNFKDYSYFKMWCNQQIGFNCRDGKKGLFHLDKDLLSNDARIYSEETCCFIPAEINCALPSPKHLNKTLALPLGVSKRKDRVKFSATLACYGRVKHLGSFITVEEAVNAWKVAKSLYFLELAEKWKDIVDPRVYSALVERANRL